jgi:hypothetical protein
LLKTLTVSPCCRYFFKVERLSVKGPLRLDLGGDEEEDLSWGDDDDEEEEEEGPNDTETDKGEQASVKPTSIRHSPLRYGPRCEGA